MSHSKWSLNVTDAFYINTSVIQHLKNYILIPFILLRIFESGFQIYILEYCSP